MRPEGEASLLGGKGERRDLFEGNHRPPAFEKAQHPGQQLARGPRHDAAHRFLVALGEKRGVKALAQGLEARPVAGLLAPCAQMIRK